MVEYSKINCNLTNIQLNKDEFSHELLSTTRQNTKLRNAINNNLAADIKLSKPQKN